MVTTLTKQIDRHDRPVSEVVTRLGRTAGVVAVRATLSICRRGNVGWNETYGPGYEAEFLVRGDGTVIGAPLECWCGTPTTLDRVLVVLGPATKESRSRSGNAPYDWEPRTPSGVSRPFSLYVTPGGLIASWS